MQLEGAGVRGFVCTLLCLPFDVPFQLNGDLVHFEGDLHLFWKISIIAMLLFVSVAGLVVLSIVAASLKGVPFWDQLAALRRDATETAGGMVDRPKDVVAPLGTQPIIQVFFIIFMVVICAVSLYMCYAGKIGFGQFWLPK